MVAKPYWLGQNEMESKTLGCSRYRAPHGMESERLDHSGIFSTRRKEVTLLSFSSSLPVMKSLKHAKLMYKKAPTFLRVGANL
jgi:hypothetical protein